MAWQLRTPSFIIPDVMSLQMYSSKFSFNSKIKSRVGDGIFQIQKLD